MQTTFINTTNEIKIGSTGFVEEYPLRVLKYTIIIDGIVYVC